MSEKISRRQKFKRFLKRNLTPTWAKHFSYQVFSFLISVAMIVGVASYAFTKSYEEIQLSFVDDFTITANTGAFDVAGDTVKSIQTAVDNNVDAVKIDVNRRPDGTVVMGNDIIVTNSDGVELTEALNILKDTSVKANLDIKDIKALSELHDLLVDYNMLDRVFLTGIDPYQADSVKENCPDVEYYINYMPSRIKIFSEDYQQKLIDLLDKTGAVGINCNHTYASRTLSDVLHENGYKLSIWTVDKSRHMKRALVNKPDNITTHKYSELVNLIEDWKK